MTLVKSVYSKVIFYVVTLLLRNLKFFCKALKMSSVGCSFGDPDPQDPHVFVPSGSINKVFSGLKYCLQNKILTPDSAKNKFLKLKIMCLRISY
jgi:hypothetical protein